MIYNPLEQFEVFPLVPLGMGLIDFSVTNSTFYLFLIFIVLVFLFKSFTLNSGGFFISNRWQSLFEIGYTFILDIVYENIGKKGSSFFPFIFSLFLFILFSNIFGLVPYSFTVTSHFIITFSLSLIVWLGKLSVGLRLHGISFFGILLPTGIPFVIAPFFIVVELLSFIIPLVSLGVRLFANMIAGHILLKVFVGFCWSIMIAGGILFVAHFIPITILFLLLFLETAVAFIQAYVFTMLTCIITGDSIRGGHLFFP